MATFLWCILPWGGNEQFVLNSLPSDGKWTLDGQGGVNTLAAANVANTWVVGNANKGAVGKIAFIGFQNLVGGTGSDVFKFTPAGTVQTINGGGGSDWLDYSLFSSSNPVTVNLATGASTNVNGGAAGSVTGILNARGGAGNDTLTGGGGNIMVGGGGTDTLLDTYSGSSASSGSLLIGGLGGDNLTAGSAGDILVGGTTSYDINNAALLAILNEWDTASSHAAAFAVLNSNAGIGASHWRLIWGTTVKDDNTADVLNGSNAVDWFFAGTGDTTPGIQTSFDYLNNKLA